MLHPTLMAEIIHESANLYVAAYNIEDVVVAANYLRRWTVNKCLESRNRAHDLYYACLEIKEASEGRGYATLNRLDVARDLIAQDRFWALKAAKDLTEKVS